MFELSYLLIIKCSIFTLDGERTFSFFDMAHYLCIDMEALGDFYYFVCYFRLYIDFHTVPHIEYLIHLLPVCARAIVNGLEQWRYREHIILDDFAIIVYKMENLGLCATCTVYHTVDFRAEFIQQHFDDWCISAGRGHN